MVVGVVGMTFPEERSKRVLSEGLEPKFSFFGAIDDDAIVDFREKFLILDVSAVGICIE